MATAELWPRPAPGKLSVGLSPLKHDLEVDPAHRCGSSQRKADDWHLGIAAGIETGFSWGVAPPTPREFPRRSAEFSARPIGHSQCIVEYSRKGIWPTES